MVLLSQMKDLVDSIGGVVGALLELELNSHFFEVVLDVLEVVLLLLQDLLLHLLRGAHEGSVLVAGQPVPFEVAVQLEQDRPGKIFRQSSVKTNGIQ